MVLAKVTNWQVAFLAAGAPGLAVASSHFFPATRRAGEGVDIERVRLHEKVGASTEDYTDLMVNSSYTYSLFGITFSSFAFAGVIYWSRAFLRGQGFAGNLVDPALAISFLAAALLGTLAGGLLAGWASRAMSGRCSSFPAWRCLPRSGSFSWPFTQVADAGLRWIVAGRGGHVAEHRALLHHHFERDDAQHARRRLRGRPGGIQPSGCHLVADSDGLGGRHVRSKRLDGHRVRPGTRSPGAARSPAPASIPRT